MGRMLKSRDFWDGFATAICSPFTGFSLLPAPKATKTSVGSCRWTDVGSSAGYSGFRSTCCALHRADTKPETDG